MNAKKICVETDQRTSDVDDKDPKVVINSLDYDSLAQIIMLLPIPERIDMEKVCTKWKEACQLAWYDIKEYKCETSIGRSYDNCLLTQSYVKEILLRCGKYLNKLSLSDVCNSSIMPFVGDHCKNLTSLEFVLDDNNADHIVQAFTQLDKLKCIKITGNYKRDNDEVNLLKIINSLPEEINEIHILYKHWFYDQRAVLFTLKKFKNLQKLTLIGFLVDELILQDIAEATTLVHLNIHSYDPHIEFPLFDKLVNLEYIKIEVSSEEDLRDVDREISTKVVNTIFCKCKNLKHLDISLGFCDLAEIPLAKWKNLKNLEYLRLSCCEVSPDLADTIVKYCKNLKHLCIEPIRSSIKAKVVKKLTKLENLESFIISHWEFKLTEKSIIAISNNCKKLKRLELDYCHVVPSINSNKLSSPSVLNELSKLQYLEHLSLFEVRIIDDNTIIAIANSCKNLKNLNIRGSSGDITETALVALTNLENLKILKVAPRNITDSFISRLKGLKEFAFGHCKNLTETGIIQFIKNNPDLKFLDVRFIDNITIDLVIAADQVTKNRTNGIILHITGCGRLLREASKPISTSQWLVVK